MCIDIKLICILHIEGFVLKMSTHTYRLNTLYIATLN